MSLRQRIIDMKYLAMSISGGYELDKKVEQYLKNYYDKLIKDKYPVVNANNKVKSARNMIEKMASWYEIRYPDALAMAIVNDKKKSSETVSENDRLENALSMESFFNSLSGEERGLLEKPMYPEKIKLSRYTNDYLHVNEKGIIDDAKVSEGIFKIPGLLVGLPVEQVYAMFCDIKALTKGNELEEAVSNYIEQERIREGLLNAVMVRIIERGVSRIGARRGFIFAKEFERDIRIPMAYGFDTTDPTMYNFMDTYLKNGGDNDIMCIEDYATRSHINHPLNVITFRDAYKMSTKTAVHFDFPVDMDMRVSLSDDNKFKKQLSKKKNK